MTLFESIGFSLAILALAISVLSIMSQIKKQQKDSLNVFLKLAELEQKLEDKLPFEPTVPPLEPTPEPTIEPSNDPVPTEPESPEESTTSKPKPYGITYKVVSQAEKMVRDVEDIDHLDIDLNILFNNEDNEFEDNYENLQKLKYFLKFHTEVFARLQKEQYLRIWTQHDPMYSIEIQYRHDGYALEAYSNIDNDYMWDKIMEPIE